MKLTCLTKGQGYYFPSCHIIEIGGFRVLVDCPLDLSALLIFSPIPVYSHRKLEEAFDCSCNVSIDTDSATHKKQRVENPVDDNSLIYGVPWYKTVSSLHLWDISFIDIVLISSPMGMLGLPFLTRNKNFSAKVYATEATKRIGQLMMEDLVFMHKEFRQFYGPEESGCAQWMKWEELEKFPPSLQERIMGKDGAELGSWLALYSAADVKDCILKVHSLKYAEESCYGGLLNIKAFSSGLDIGTSNWEIKSPKKDVVFISSSVLVSATALNFNYHALQNSDVAVFSDFSSLESNEVDTGHSTAINENAEVESLQSLIDSDESSEEEQKLSYICSYAIDSLKVGGSVLIPSGRVGVVLQLLEQLSLLACEPLFAHVDLMKEKRLHLLPSIFATDLLKIWQEPCIVFAPHWSLRLGPAVHLLQHWHGNENSLLILERGLDADLALLPFKPMAMKVLQCSFLSGMRSSKVVPLLENLQPKYALLPEDLKSRVENPRAKSVSMIYYNENWISLKEEEINITRIKGELSVEHGKYRLLKGNESKKAYIDSEKLAMALQNLGIKTSAEQTIGDGSGRCFVLQVHEPSKALIEVRPTRTLISTSDKNLAFHITRVVDSILCDT
ncbi:Integrator complex subunit 9-like protein [Bienertia sinuspersici]